MSKGTELERSPMNEGNLKSLLKGCRVLIGLNALLVLWAYIMVVSVETPEPLDDFVNELLSVSVNVH
jgi:hypothetical protein